MTSGVDKGTSQRLLKTFNNTNQQIFYFVSSLKKNLTSICFENIFDFLFDDNPMNMKLK